MPADPTTGPSGDRSRYCLSETASAQPNGKCGRVVRISLRRSANLSRIRAIRHRARGRPCDRTRNPVPSISLLRVTSEGGGS
jgi:hypothetical protein